MGGEHLRRQKKDETQGHTHTQKKKHTLTTRPEAVPSVSKSVATAQHTTSWMEHSVIFYFISAVCPPPRPIK